MLGLEINLADSLLRFLIVYRPPNYDPKSKKDFAYLLTLLPTFLNTRSPVFLLGDFNLPRIDWVNGVCSVNDNLHDLFLNFTSTHLLTQSVLFPTTLHGSTLDLILSSDSSIISDVDSKAPLGLSDHMVISFTILCSRSPPIKIWSSVPAFDKANFTIINSVIASIDWAYLLGNCANVDALWHCFTQIIHQIIFDNVPFRRVSINRARAKFYPKYVRTLISKKAQAWRLYRRFGTPVFYDRYLDLSSKASSAISSHIASGENKLIEKGNLGSFFRYVNRHLHNKSGVGALHSPDGRTVTSDDEKTALLSSHFSSGYTTDDGLTYPFSSRTTDSCIISDENFNPVGVSNRLRHLKPKSGAGPDGIPALFYKATSDTISFPLSIIFKYSFRVASLPHDWKHAYVTPVHKKGPLHDPNNYRPISLTCVGGKVIAMAKRL